MVESELGNLDKKIRFKIMEQLYRNPNTKMFFHNLVKQAVNNEVPLLPTIHDKSHFDQLKENGFIIFNNFLNEKEVAAIKNLVANEKGYNAHVPVYSDGILRNYDDSYPFQTLSYCPKIFLKNKLILEKINHPYLLSLVQEYLGCFPTLYSLNCWWSKFSPNIYSTQNNHRDEDDFKFLAFFIYLSDVDEANGPHVFYPKTQEGQEISSSSELVITGKSGTAILADTFAFHRGQQLKERDRCVIWWRYGTYVNEIYMNDRNYDNKVQKIDVFSKISEGLHSRHLMRAFLSDLIG